MLVVTADLAVTEPLPSCYVYMQDSRSGGGGGIGT